MIRAQKVDSSVYKFTHNGKTFQIDGSAIVEALASGWKVHEVTADNELGEELGGYRSKRAALEALAAHLGINTEAAAA